MGGYGIALDAPPRTATGPFSPLWVRAMALWDAGRPYVLVSADLLGWSTMAAAEVRQRVADATGLPVARLLLVSTHTHNGAALPGVTDPWLLYGLADTTAIEGYQRRVVDTVVELVRQVLTGPRQDVTVDFQATTASFAANREGLPYVETDVPVLVARRPDGRPLAVAFGFGAHPVCAGQQVLWDGDYPAAAAAAIEAVFPGSTALFLPGAAGDQDPTGTRGWALRHARGAQLAAAVVTAAAAPGRALTAVSAARLATATLPLDVTLAPGNLAAVRSACASRISSGGPGWVVRHAQRMVDLIDSGASIATELTLPVQVWVLAGTSPLRMAFVGGEIVSGYAVHFRQRYGGAAGLWLGGYGPGSIGYLPSDALLPPLRRGGSYAGGWDTDHPGIAGGSMCLFGPMGHYRAGSSGVEPAIIDALAAQLA